MIALQLFQRTHSGASGNGKARTLDATSRNSILWGEDVTGLYGKTLPNQDGAPLRLIVPWKYGFKGIKAIVRISFVDKQPRNTWQLANPDEYGFYANVNPEVDHPRWTQASENAWRASVSHGPVVLKIVLGQS